MASDEQLKAIELFSELSKRELKSVQKLMTTTNVSEGRQLMVEGEIGLEFMVILSGTATVSRGGKAIGDLETGDFVGELAVIAGVPRAATVTATSQMELSVLSRAEFSTLLDKQPGIARKVLVGAVKRLHDLEISSHD